MQVQSCCACCSLKAGTITIGILCAILSMASLVLDFTTNMDVEYSLVASWYFSIISTGLSVLFSILLIIAVLTDHVFLLLPWLFLYIWIIIGSIIGITYMITMISLNGLIWVALMWFAFGVVFIMLMMYAWIVVYSYLRKVKRDRMTGKVLSPYEKQFAYHNP